MKKEEFISLLHDPEKMNNADNEIFSEIIAVYPLFTVARVLQIIACGKKDPEKFQNCFNKNVSFLHNSKYLFNVCSEYSVNGEMIIGKQLFQEEISRKNEIIEAEEQNAREDINLYPADDLLSFEYKTNKYPSEIEKPETEYTQDESSPEAEQVEYNSQNRKNELVDKFIHTNPRSTRPSELSENPVDISRSSNLEDDSLITDTLARIYVKQGLYSKAIYSYEKLILKYPEKSDYFASQIEKINSLINK